MDHTASAMLLLIFCKSCAGYDGYTYIGAGQWGDTQAVDAIRDLSGEDECADECNLVAYCVSFTWSTQSDSCYMHHQKGAQSYRNNNLHFYTKDAGDTVADISRLTTGNGVEYEPYAETLGSSGHIIETLSIPSSFSCREECDNNPSCVAANFKLYGGDCTLHDAIATGGSDGSYVFYIKIRTAETTVVTEATTTVTEMITTTMQDTTALTTDMTTTEEETTIATEAKTTVTEMATTTLRETTATKATTTVTEMATTTLRETTALTTTEGETTVATTNKATTEATAAATTTEKPPFVTSSWSSSSDTISIPSPSVPSTHINSSIPRVECLCHCKDTPNRTLEESIAEITARLTVRKESLSSTVRKLTSASDDRHSSEQLGYLGIAMISFAVVFMTFSDFCSVCLCMYKSISNCVSREG